MATDPFDDIALITEIGQPTFVELIVAKQETGQAIRTICYDDTDREEICEEGPSPALRLRELAYGKKRQIPNPPLTGIPSAIPAVVQNVQAYKITASNNSVQDAKIAKIENDFYNLVTNSPTIQVAPSASTCTSNVLINGEFDSNLAAWNVTGDVFWQSSTASAVLRRNPSDSAPELFQLAIIQADKILRLDFDLAVFFEYDDWELSIEVRNNTIPIYTGTVTKADGFGTFSIGDIPAATTGIVTVEFSNTSTVVLESKLLNIDNVKLCFDDASNTLICDAGFNVIEKTDFSADGQKNWEADGATVTDRLNLTSIVKPINFTGAHRSGVFFANDQNQAGAASGTFLSESDPSIFDLDGKIPRAIDADDPNGHVYMALEGTVTSDIVRFNYDGSNRTILYSHATTADDILVDTVNGFIYYNRVGALRRIDLDGTNDTALYSLSSGSILRMALDITNDHIYLVRNLTPADSNIVRVDTDGTDETIIDSAIVDPRSIALDVQNQIIYVGTGEVSGEVLLHTLTFAGVVTQIFSTTPIISPNTSASLRSISDLEFHIHGQIYMAGGFGIWTINPDGSSFTNIFQPTSFVDAADVIGTLHVAYQRATVVRKLFRDLVPDSPVRFTALFDDVISAGEDRVITVELARPEGGSLFTILEGSDTVTVTYSAGASGILSANIIFENRTNLTQEISGGVFECLVCGGDAGTRPQCSPSAPVEIDFQNFTGDNGGWIGDLERPSSWNSTLGLHEINSDFGFLTKIFTGLTAGSVIEFHFDIINITAGGKVKLLISEQPGNAIVETEYTITGVDITVSAITDIDTISVQFSYEGIGSAQLDNILICTGVLDSCRITNVSTELIWDGSPIRPINIFEGFLRYKIRGRIDPTAVAFVDQPIRETSHLSSVQFCDFWKQQGNGSVPEANPLVPTVNTSTIKANDETAINDRNWVWSTPVSGTGNDTLLISVDDPQQNTVGRIATGDLECGAHIDEPNYDGTCIVETVSIMLHMNRILTLTDLTDLCPLLGLTIRLNFTDGKDINRSYEQDIDLAALYSIAEGLIDPSIPWDEMTALGDGISGDTARWESFDFLLDGLSGNGLNQCSTVTTPTFTGTGVLNLSDFAINSTGFTADDCEPEVTITTEDEGSKTDEVQSIILPHPSSGTYDITLSDKGVTDTVTIPWNADATQLRVKLGALTSVGGTRNVLTTGTGEHDDPFLVTFTDQLSARDMNSMIANDDSLLGTGEALIRTLRDGTLNEQQTITNTTGTLQNFRITFNEITTVEMPFNVSLNEMKQYLEGLSSIGTGNVEVVGGVKDPDIPYSGPWTVKFQNDLGGENLVEMYITSLEEGYIVQTDWNGGGGINEVQQLKIGADEGTYTLTFTHFTNSADVQITGDIAFNASASEILAVIVGSITWLNTTNFAVRFSDDDPFLIHQLIFKADLWGINIPQISVSNNLLKGGETEIAEIIKGGGNREKQRIRMKNVTGGTWGLIINVPNVGNLITYELDWDSTAAAIETAFIALPGVTSGDVSVSGDFPVYLVVFRKTLGNIDLLEAFVDNLVCDGFVVVPIPPPPYDYELNQEPNLTPPPLASLRLPLADSKNVFTRTNYQRYLFDPNYKPNLTLREMALVKGVDLLDYTPYRRTCDNSNLVPVTFDQIITTKDSYVLVEKAIDSILERQRILKHFKTHREILPARFTWECLET